METGHLCAPFPLDWVATRMDIDFEVLYFAVAEL